MLNKEVRVTISIPNNPFSVTLLTVITLKSSGTHFPGNITCRIAPQKHYCTEDDSYLKSRQRQMPLFSISLKTFNKEIPLRNIQQKMLYKPQFPVTKCFLQLPPGQNPAVINSLPRQS